jgi:uncharacterized delta-60 repeat protein/uncharacterized repeat protein (TIGR01451 family)
MKTFFALFLTLNCFFLLAQPGKVDTTFNAPFYDLFETGNGFSANPVNCVYEQPDGKLIIAGQFTAFNGVGRIGIARLNSNGILDPTFDAGTTFQNLWQFKDIALQPDGKIILARVTGLGSLNLRRINPDGSLDAAPIVPGNLSGVIEKILIQPDGKLILCGGFSYQDVNMTNYFGLVRFNTDGSVDQTFTGGNGFTSSSFSLSISGLKLDALGRILITGSFDTYNGVNSRGVIRLNQDGTIDNTFNLGTGLNNYVNSIVIQPDQKIILAGEFTDYQTFISAHGIIRLNPDGSPDPTFQSNSQPFTSANNLNLMPDNSIILTANNSNAFPPLYTGLVRLLSNGILDTITAGHETNGPGGGNTFSQISLLSSGKLLLTGQFETAFNRFRGGIAVMNEDFTLDNSFNPKPGFKDEIEQVFVQPDGKIYATKEILDESTVNVYNDIIVKGLVRINSDGSLDTTFHIPDSLLVSAEAVVVQPDAKVVVAGMTKIYDGSNWVSNRNIVRFNPDGSLDQSFETVELVANNLDKLLLQPDGKIIILGGFSLDNGNTYPCISRLNPNGTLDNSFNIGSGANNRITTGLITSSGKIIIGGDFTSYNGIPVQRLAAINPNGSLDLTFAFDGDIGGTVRALEKQADGKMYLTASNLGDNNNFAVEILRLNQDGSIDTSYYSDALDPFGSDVIFTLLPLPDGKLMVGGSIHEFGSESASGIVLVNADGSRDTTFYSNYVMTEPEVLVKSISLGFGGEIVIGGTFSKVADKPSNNIAVVYTGLTDHFEVSFTAVSNVGCAGNGSVTAIVSGGFPPYQYVWTNSSNPLDSAQIISTGGIYTCTVTDSLGFVNSASLLIDGPAYTNGFDLKSNLIASSFRSGFDNTIFLNTVNDGCIPVSGQLICVLDPLVQFNSSTPAPDYSSSDTLIWNFSNLTYDSGNFLPILNTTVSSAAQIGDSITINLFVTPVSGDSDTLNNSRSYTFPIINGYDPNIKSVYPVGKCDEAYVENGQKFTYTVQFQNTGNAEAINIVVTDSLDTDLNLNTLHIVDNSHPVWMEIVQGNTVKFHFDSINLPDSSFNEAASHGHLVFEIDPVSDTLSHNTVISNKAEIYFDFNPAIITNTCSNTIYDGDLDDLACDPGNDLVDSIVVTTIGGVPGQITTPAGTLQLQAVVYPFAANQSVIWSIIQVTGGATISVTGLVTASDNGTVWAKVLSAEDPTKADSILITITNQDLGITALKGSDFSVFPNPTSNRIIISTNSKQEEMMQVVITDLFGKEVHKSTKDPNKNLELDLRPLETGTYILIIRGVSGELVKSSRIVKI